MTVCCLAESQGDSVYVALLKLEDQFVHLFLLIVSIASSTWLF